MDGSSPSAFKTKLFMAAAGNRLKALQGKAKIKELNKD
jgi:hypothetical protein